MSKLDSLIKDAHDQLEYLIGECIELPTKYSMFEARTKLGELRSYMAFKIQQIIIDAYNDGFEEGCGR